MLDVPRMKADAQPVGEGGVARRVPAWGSLWRVVENQAHNAFNDKVAQFVLLALAEVLVVSEWYPQIVSALLVLPQLFLAPLAGWMADRWSKRRILIWCSMAQVVLLVCIAGAFRAGWFWTATGLFFLLAVQAAIYGPAKSGIVKELVGERHLTVASGWMQMTMILAFAGGQLLGGKAFEHYHDDVFGGDPWRSAAVPVLVLAGAALLPLVLAFQVERTPEHTADPFHRGLFTGHFRDLDDLLQRRRVRLTALGVSFFWLAATMLTLMLIELAAEIEPNRASRAALSSELLGFVAAGVAVGSILTGKLSANRIELGLVPIGGAGMALASALAFLAEPGGGWCRLLIFGIGACSALFMVPLHASLQDQVEPKVRGRLLSAAGLLDSLGMMSGILLQLLLMRAGMGVRGQFLVLGVLCLATAVCVLRIIPQNFIRLLIIGLVRVIYRIRVVHGERVPEHGPALLICNHVSYIDAVILSAACDRAVRFAAYEAFFRHPLLGPLMHLFGAVPISRSRAKDAVVALSEALKAGDVVCVFPEGQLTRTGMMNGLQKGYELIARRAGAPVVPVYMDDLWGSIFSSERGRFLRKHPHHFPYHVSVLFGGPVPAERMPVERAREAFQALAAEGLADRGEVTRGLAKALAHALCRQPWHVAGVDAEGVGRQTLLRGELFARAMRLARRWQDFPVHRVGVVLPPGRLAVTVHAALALCGRAPVAVEPAAGTGGGEALRRLMEAEGIRTVVTTAAMRRALTDFPWPDHVLDAEAELEEMDEVHVLRDMAVAWLAPAFSVTLHLPDNRGPGGCGGIAWTAGGPVAVFLTDAELMMQTELLRGTDLMREGERLLNAEGFARPLGLVAGLWGPLLRGIPLLLPPEAPDVRESWLAAWPAAVGLGPVESVRALPEPARERLRLWLHEAGDAAADIGVPLCPCLAPPEAGGLVAVSMPDPPILTSTAGPQAGHRSGSCGRLLTGIRAVAGAGGMVRLELPGGRSLTLPPGTRIDEDGFLFLPSGVTHSMESA